MKKLLLLTLALPALLLVQSCTKAVSSPSIYDQVDISQITGTWYLGEAAQYNGGGWNYFNTGLEKGIFTFYASGAASYDDGYNRMDGNWSVVTISDGYYDRYGVFHSDIHDAFKLHLYDSYSNNSITLNFDDIYATGGTLVGTSYSGGTISRYTFYRYFK